MTIQRQTSPGLVRWLAVAGLVAVAFFGAYKFAAASAGAAGTPQSAAAKQSGIGSVQTETNASAGSASTSGGGCDCGGGSAQPATDGVTGPQVDGTAQVRGSVQTIAVKVTTVYSPNVIHLKPGVPALVTFSSAQGCTSAVQSRQLGFDKDLSTGPKTVRIENPQAGTYDFSCGMNMVHGKIVVE
jgi:hypothetical protein